MGVYSAKVIVMRFQSLLYSILIIAVLQPEVQCTKWANGILRPPM